MDFMKFIYDSYIISQPLFCAIDQGSSNYIFIEDKYYLLSISSNNDIKTLRLKISFTLN